MARFVLSSPEQLLFKRRAPSAKRDIKAASAALSALLGCALSLAANHADASAKQPSESELAAARVLGSEGIKLASARKCKSAIPLLEQAAHFYAAPTIIEPLARCKIHIGKLRDGSQLLTRILASELPQDAPAPFVEAQARAEALLARTLPRLVRLNLSFINITDKRRAQIFLNDERLSINALKNLSIDPGRHLVRIEYPGYELWQRPLLAQEGSRVNLQVQLRPIGAEDSSQKIGDGTSDNASASDGGPTQTAAWVSLGVGISGIATGGVLGILALGKTTDAPCQTTSCRQTNRDNEQAKVNLLNGSLISFGIGAVGLGLASYLMLSGEPPAEPSASQGARIGAYIGPEQLGLFGEF